ncbi:hypothetical protein N7488_000164 [Penicillium malachiteum]|nr:hypothetical protein N7488_000164 [Penicillium malachiteum]
MEALGLVANIAAVIQITAQVTQLSYSYFREVKNAPKIQKQYLQEASALMEVLFRVETVIVETESTGLLPPRPASLDDEALMRCYEEISRLYYELQKRKSRILRPFQNKELRPHIDMLQQFRENLSEYLSACILVTTNATYQKVSSLSIGKKVINGKHLVKIADFAIKQSRNILLTSVAPPPVSIREKPDPCPGTDTWFLKTTELRCWIRGTTQLLWCYGPPGVGKSYLASIAIDHLLKQTSNDVLAIHFLCDFSSQNEHTTINVLRSLIRQIIERGGEKILGALKDLVDETNTPQNAANITKMIAKAGLSQAIYLVLITSRKLPHIEKKMKTATQFEITGSTDDMKLYIGKRLLSLEEILTAFSVDDQGLDSDNMPSSDVLLRICVGLVVVNKTDNTLGLVHTSAYEYLSNLLCNEKPHLDIAQTCLRYLGQRGIMDQPCQSSTELIQRFDDFKFLCYAAKHWGHQICDQESQKELQPLILKLINDDGLRHSSFQALQFRLEFEGVLADEIFESLPQGPHAPHIAAYWNLIEIVEVLIEADADLSAVDSHKWTPLHWACANNHPQVAALLILKGVDVNAPEGGQHFIGPSPAVTMPLSMNFWSIILS